MDATEAKALVDNLRKAKISPKPYFWSFVLEGGDGEPCLFFEKKETLAKKKAKEARKKAKKKKMASGMMDYSSGKMVLRSDGAVADNLIEKAIKKLIKAHSELGLLKRLRVDSSAVEVTEDEPVDTTPTVNNTNDTTETEPINTSISMTWANQWETRYEDCKRILKEASKTDAAKKDKVKNKLSDYKDRLKNARSDFKAASPPYDEMTQQSLQAKLDKAASSIFKLAEKLGISIPSQAEPENNDGDGTHADEIQDNIMATLIAQASQTPEEQSLALDKDLQWPDKSSRLIARLDQTWVGFDKEIDRFQNALLSHPEVANDPRVGQLQSALSNINSMLPKRSSKLHKYLTELGKDLSVDDRKVALKKAKKVLEQDRQTYENDVILTYLESNSIGSFPAKSALLSTFSYIETILNA